MMIRINLLPAETKVQIPKAYKHLGLGLVVLLIGMGAIYYVWDMTNTHYQEKVDEAAKKEKISKELDAIIAEVNHFKKVKQDLEEKLDTIQKLKDNQKGPLRLLVELRERFPKQVWVSRVVFRNPNVQLVGFGLTLTTVGELVENLKASAYFKDINYRSSRSVSGSGVKYYNFDIGLRFTIEPDKTKPKPT